LEMIAKPVLERENERGRIDSLAWPGRAKGVQLPS